MSRFNLRFILLAVLGLILIAVVAFLTIRQAPKADVVSPNSTPELATAWGKVTYTDSKKPAGGLAINLGSVGATIQPDGTYMLSTSETGELPVRIENDSTSEIYQLVGNSEQQFEIKKGDTVNLDFTIKKVDPEPNIEQNFSKTVSPTPTPAANSNPLLLRRRR